MLYERNKDRNFSSEIVQDGRKRYDSLKVLKGKICQPRILNPEKNYFS